MAELSTTNIHGDLFVSGAISGNTSSASRWQTPRTLTLSGGVTGSVDIDGSANATISTTLSNHNLIDTTRHLVSGLTTGHVIRATAATTYAFQQLAHADLSGAGTGNHVPTIAAANNAIFLRNDNTWQTVTPLNIGAVATDRTITAGTGLTGGGNLTADRTLAVSFGTTASTVCVGNDARLSDNRTPNNHALVNTTNHTVSGLTTGHVLRATAATTYAFQQLAHTDLSGAGTGNHVPTIAAANNAIFLRNDNTWQTVTPLNIGAVTISGTLLTSSGATGATRWTRIATVTLNQALTGISTQIFINDIESSSTRGTLMWHYRVGATIDVSAGHSLQYMSAGGSAVNAHQQFRSVIITRTVSQVTIELWAQSAINFATYSIQVLSSNNSIEPTYQAASWVAAAPTVFVESLVATSPNLTATNITTTNLTTTNITTGDTTTGRLILNNTTHQDGHFYAGTTVPTGTTRGNFSGHFHATALFEGNIRAMTSVYHQGTTAPTDTRLLWVDTTP